ncbi:MAG: CGGC domain-containing protein [Nitrospira bacterium HGW-Nitrospira-1]|nr:MAG: CGGC domain-containing protein [Nitrospira bacterium HGW-Nitrospira-1]
MARIGILTCSNATQDLGCSSAGCLAALRKRKGAFADYPQDQPLDLIGIINCPGCPTLTGTDKLLQRIRALTEFRTDAIHFTYCMKALCPFKEKYKTEVEKEFPNVKVVIGTHQEHITPEEYREKVKKLFNQQRKTMIDVILDKNVDNKR